MQLLSQKAPILPAIHTTLGALPARFRRQRLLVVGCGDVGLRIATMVRSRMTVRALTSSDHRVALMRAAGITPLPGNLDRPPSLARLAALATHVIHLAPPLPEGESDTRTKALICALRRRNVPAALVYASTSGVYGDCRGAWVDEVRRPNPTTPRAMRRLDAERQLRVWARGSAVRSSILRVPGIYAKDRANGTPRARLEKCTPVLIAQEDVYTNHIHAEDLARACIAALWRGKTLRAYNVCDDTALKMGDYLDVAADLYQLPRPPRVSRQVAQSLLPSMQMSFLSESRRLNNHRMKAELGLRLRYPTVFDGLT